MGCIGGKADAAMPGDIGGEMKYQPLRLRPCYKEYLWGGRRLKAEFNKVDAPDVTAESWELAAHKDGFSTVADGFLQGKSLADLGQMDKPGIWGSDCKCEEFPVMVKLIDAAKDLSIQVHPSDETALSQLGESGKAEMWYIVECEPKAFKYLCDLTTWSGTVKCNVATGIMSGGTGAGAHMWNIVTIGNANYLADITNCDDGTIGYPDELFLCGVSGSRDAYAAHGVSYEYDSTTQTIFTEEERTLSSTPFDPASVKDVAKIRAFVERMYTKCLGRAAETSGTEFWIGELLNGKEGSTLALEFFSSEEYRNKNLTDEQFIETLYQTFFDRTGDIGGIAYWMGEMKTGTDRSVVFAGFCNSEEFTLLCESSGIVRGTFIPAGQDMGHYVDIAKIRAFVERMYTKSL